MVTVPQGTVNFRKQIVLMIREGLSETESLGNKMTLSQSFYRRVSGIRRLYNCESKLFFFFSLSSLSEKTKPLVNCFLFLFKM